MIVIILRYIIVVRIRSNADDVDSICGSASAGPVHEPIAANTT